MHSRDIITTGQRRGIANMIVKNKKPARVTAALLALTMLITVMLAGCSDTEIGLLAAILKAPPMTSYEYEGSAAIELRFDIIEAEDEYRDYYRTPVSTFKMIEEVVNGAGINISSKYMSNEDKTKSAMEMMLTPVYLGGRLENLTTGIWAEVDLDAPVFLKEYIKLPKIFTAGMAWEVFKNREYLTITSEDFEAIADEADLDFNAYFDIESLKAQIEASENLNAVFADAIILLAGLMDTDTAYITGVDIGSAGESVYHVKITDKGFKELISKIFSIDKEDLKEVLRLFLTATLEVTQAFEKDDAEVFGELSDYLSMALSQIDFAFELFYPQVAEIANKYLGKNSKVKILGNDGLTFDISVSKDGFITGFDGILDLLIDHRGYAISTGERFTDTVSKTHIKLKFENKFTHINEDKPIAMPAITRINSVSLSRLLEAVMAQYSPGMYYPYGLDPYFAIEGYEFEGAAAMQERPDMLGELPADSLSEDL